MYRQACENVMCHVFVFGGSVDVCPGCGKEGRRLSAAEDDQLLQVVRR